MYEDFLSSTVADKSHIIPKLLSQASREADWYQLRSHTDTRHSDLGDIWQRQPGRTYKMCLFCVLELSERLRNSGLNQLLPLMKGNYEILGSPLIQ